MPSLSFCLWCLAAAAAALAAKKLLGQGSDPVGRLARAGIDHSLEYDYIIVGSGPAGCVLASRLSSDPSARVLLLESGGSAWPAWAASAPAAAPALMLASSGGWGYTTVPQREALGGFNDRVAMVPRGRFAGGTSQMNFHIHNVTGAEEDQTFWDSISQLEPDPQTRPVMSAFLAAAAGDGARASPVSSLIRDGRRHNFLDIFLKPALDRDNLHYVPHHEVTKLYLESGRVSSLEVRNRRSQGMEILGCRGGCRVVLSAGSINSPKLLVSSGIGPKDMLEKLEIPVALDLPVGSGLFDHMAYPLYFGLDGGAPARTVNLLRILNPAEVFRYLVRGEGLWSSSWIDAQAHFPGSGTLVLLYNVAAPEKAAFTAISNMEGDTFDALFPGNRSPTKEGFILLCICLGPRSRGSLTFEWSGSPVEGLRPVIDPAYLTDPADVECMKKAVRQGLSLGGSPSFASALGAAPLPNFPPAGLPPCSGAGDGDAALECAVRAAAMTMYHPVGTAAEGAVVDRNLLQVRGVANLHVCDASVVSDLSRDFPVAAVYNKAKRLAEKLLELRGTS